jgi:hypothetical protein
MEKNKPEDSNWTHSHAENAHSQCCSGRGALCFAVFVAGGSREGNL